MQRAVSVNHLYSKKFEILKLSGQFAELIGHPEKTGSWIIWGDSGNGKTSFACQLCKYLTQFAKVMYNSREEGLSETMRLAFKRAKMEEVSKKIVLIDKGSNTEIAERLRKQRAATILITDSVQHSRITIQEYNALLKEFPNVLFIWISHEDKKLPKGGVADFIRYDASVKIRVVGFKAFCLSRYRSDTTPYIISSDKANAFWGNGLLEDKKII